MRKWYDTLYNFLALASRRRSKGLCPSQKTPRQRARQFYERARQAVRYGALSTRVARSLLRRKNAFRRNAQQASQFYERKKLWFTSSTWGGWWFAALLLAVVGAIGFCIYFKSNDMNALKHVQLYAVIVIGLGSLYIAGTNLWEKMGSAFFVEYQTTKDMNTAEFIRSSVLLEEVIGNPANSTMPYVKRIYIRNEKNKHEAIKRILLQLPNKHTLMLKEYEKADALLIKPYEDKVLELKAATVYAKKSDFFLLGREIAYCSDKFMIIQNEAILQKGEVIIETVLEQSYIKNNKISFVSYDKKEVLTPLSSTFRSDDFNQMVLDINVLFAAEIAMRENIDANNIFYNELIDEFNLQVTFVPGFSLRKLIFKIQITLNKNREFSLCFSFQINKKNYVFPVRKKLQEEFTEKYNKYGFKNLNCDDFVDRFESFYIDWAEKKWGKGEDSIVDYFTAVKNPFAVANLNIEIIDDEEP